MSRSYELSYDGTQLYETLHMTVGRSNTPLIIRYVYDQAAGALGTSQFACGAADRPGGGHGDQSLSEPGPDRIMSG